MITLLDIAVVSIVSFFMGLVTSMSGLNLGRFTVVAHVESSVPVAVGTAIGITAMVTMTTVASYIKAGLIHRKAFLTMTITGVTGCIIASYFTVLLPSLLVLLMIAASMTWSIYRIVRSGNAKTDLQNIQQTGAGRHARQYMTGFIVGSLGGLMGVIFSSMVLGSLVHVVKENPKMLVGTTLAFSAVLGVCGVLAHLVHGNMNVLLLVIMGSAGMMGGAIGSEISITMNPKNLKMILISIQAGTLVYLAFMIAITILRPAIIHCRSCF